MQAIEHLDYGETYHVYNAGVQHSVLFRDDHDYERFLSDYQRYLSVVAHTLAWCLMGNHFHFVITIMKEEEIKPFAALSPANQLKSYLPPSMVALSPSVVALSPSVVANPDGGSIPNYNQQLSGEEVNTNFQPPSGSLTTDRVVTDLRKPKPSTQLSHLFNSYAQYYNKKYQRRGVLFEKGFRRKLVYDPEYLKNLVDYIHNNPVRHRFVDHPGEYPWSSYTTGRLTTTTHP